MKKKTNLVAWHTPPMRPATVLPLRGLCPAEDRITDYDRRNMALYTWLLVASEDGAGVEELAADVFHFDLSHDRTWALRVTLSHLERAQWVHDQMFPCIDEAARAAPDR